MSVTNGRLRMLVPYLFGGIYWRKFNWIDQPKKGKFNYTKISKF